MSVPFFSIIVPVYKVDEGFLRECIESILAQSFYDFEAIFVDDGSPDQCGKICDEYAQMDPRIRVIHQSNQGVSVARNHGLEAAYGQWILFVDGDDWIEPDTCQILYEKLIHTDCDILMFHAVRESQDQSIVMDYGLVNECMYSLVDPDNKEFLYKRVMGVSIAGNKSVYPVYYSWDKAYKRTFLVNNRVSFPTGLAKSEDKVFVCACFQNLERLFCIKEALYHYRMNDESICHRYSANIDMQRIQLTNILEPIAKDMDQELAHAFHKHDYHAIYDEYIRFVFGAITDVLYLKYFHKDNPNRHGRRRAAMKFLKTEPFASSIKLVPYASLSLFSKVKKVMLRYGCVSLFCWVSMKYRSVN